MTLKEAHETSTHTGGRHFCEVDRSQNRGAAYAETADEPEHQQSGPVPRQGRANCGDDVEHRHPAQGLARTDALPKGARGERANHRPPERDGDRKAKLCGGEGIDLRKAMCRAGDDRCIKTEKHASECAHKRAA